MMILNVSRKSNTAYEKKRIMRIKSEIHSPLSVATISMIVPNAIKIRIFEYNEANETISKNDCTYQRVCKRKL